MTTQKMFLGTFQRFITFRPACTKKQSVEETAEMTAFCAALQCDTDRHAVSLLRAQRMYIGSVFFQ